MKKKQGHNFYYFIFLSFGIIPIILFARKLLAYLIIIYYYFKFIRGPPLAAKKGIPPSQPVPLNQPTPSNLSDFGTLEFGNTSIFSENTIVSIPLIKQNRYSSITV